MDIKSPQTALNILSRAFENISSFSFVKGSACASGKNKYAICTVGIFVFERALIKNKS